MTDERSDWLNLKSFVILCVAVGLVIAGAAIGYTILSGTQWGVPGSGYKVKSGDEVTVDYIGMFEDGRVFDTSIESVATNDALFPKSLSFNPWSSYSPLTFTVGEGEMIAGFDNGVIGMIVNQTRTLTIPPEEGYGYHDENLIETMDLTMSIPVYEWDMNLTTFEEKYFVQAEYGTTVRSIEYGWNATVYYIDPTGNVKLKNEPRFHEIIKLHQGWASEVISIDTSANDGEGEIIVKHQLTPEDAGYLLSYDEGGNEFRVIAVNPGTNTATLDYNREVVDETLIFKVTIVSITPGD